MTKHPHPGNLVTRTEQLRSIVGDLTEVHGLLSLLCTHLEEGGTVDAAELEPVISEAVPRLRQAVSAMNILTHQGGNTLEGCRTNVGTSKNPLLM